MYDAWKRFRARESSPDGRSVLDVLYAVPDLLESDERYFHEDLIHMTPDVLKLEHRRVVGRLIHDDAPPDWLMARLDAIDGRLRYGA